MDLVIVTKIDHLYTVNLSLPLIKKYISKLGRIIIVTKRKNKKYFKVIDDKIDFIDEDNILPKLTFEKIREMDVYGFPKRAGWYFQQLLKMGMANLEEISDNYIVWDADTVPLKKINLINEDKTYNFVKSDEYHEPYFINYERLLNEKPNYEFSFISQFMIFNKNIMKEIFEKIEKNFGNNDPWYICILNNIVGNDFSLFSEYETYGNYIKNHYPELCNFINIKWLRQGTDYIGTPFPKLEYLNKLSKEYYYISFELRSVDIISKIKKKLFINVYPYYLLLKHI